jgi:hypothetical protein
MKKIVALSVMALAVLALSGQKASAWSNIKFGVGLNLSYTGGGNNFLWGAYKSQQPPAQGYGAVPPPVPGGIPPAMPGAFGPGFGGYGPGFGGGFDGGYGAQGAAGYNLGQEAAAAPAAQGSTPPSKVEPVNYQTPSYNPNPYLQAGYGLPVGYQSNQAPAPSYWYGR